MPYLDSQYKDIPVRTFFQGVREVNGQLIPYEENREYYKFRANFVRESAFQTPESVHCPGRIRTKPLPPVPKQFKISIEKTSQTETTHLRNFVYDGVRRAVKYELRPLQANEEFATADKISVIHDYNTGISFTRSLVHGNCTIGPISFNSFDEDNNFTASTFHESNAMILKLNSPERILQLDSDYAFTAARSSRSLPADIFVADRRAAESSGVISEFAFSKQGFLFNTRVGRIDKIPLSVHRTSVENIHMNDYVNFYAFDPGMVGVEEFDTSMCYKKAEKFEVGIKFPYEGELKLIL